MGRNDVVPDKSLGSSEAFIHENSRPSDFSRHHRGECPSRRTFGEMNTDPRRLDLSRPRHAQNSGHNGSSALDRRQLELDENLGRSASGYRLISREQRRRPDGHEVYELLMPRLCGV